MVGRCCSVENSVASFVLHYGYFVCFSYCFYSACWNLPLRVRLTTSPLYTTTCLKGCSPNTFPSIRVGVHSYRAGYVPRAGENSCSWCILNVTGRRFGARDGSMVRYLIAVGEPHRAKSVTRAIHQQYIFTMNFLYFFGSAEDWLMADIIVC